MNKNEMVKKMLFISLVLYGLSSGAQNIGIGTNSPGAKLQVNHRSSTTTPGVLMFDSTASRSGHIRFRNMGSSKYMELWGYSGNNSFSAEQYLDVESDSLFIATFRGNGNVGIGNITPAERLDVSGNINLTGVLKVNGNAGTVGQVLTSNGTADPQWKTSAYSHNTRFAIEFNGNGILNATNTYYNSNPAEIIIGSNYFTINRIGLYRFEGNFSPYAQGNNVNLPESTIWLAFTGGVTINYHLSRRRSMPEWQGGGNNYEFNDHFSLDVYIPAPTLVRVNSSYNNITPGTVTVTGVNLFCHLISE